MCLIFCANPVFGQLIFSFEIKFVFVCCKKWLLDKILNSKKESIIMCLFCLRLLITLRQVVMN